MQIYYPKRRLMVYLTLGVIAASVALYRIFGQKLNDFYTFSLLLLGLLYIGGCIYYYKKNYIQVTSHKIKVNALLPYEIMISNITEATYDGETYTFKSNTKQISFQKSQIDNDNQKCVEEFYQSVKKRLKYN